MLRAFLDPRIKAHAHSSLQPSLFIVLKCWQGWLWHQVAHVMLIRAAGRPGTATSNTLSINSMPPYGQRSFTMPAWADRVRTQCCWREEGKQSSWRKEDHYWEREHDKKEGMRLTDSNEGQRTLPRDWMEIWLHAMPWPVLGIRSDYMIRTVSAGWRQGLLLHKCFWFLTVKMKFKQQRNVLQIEGHFAHHCVWNFFKTPKEFAAARFAIF